MLAVRFIIFLALLVKAISYCAFITFERQVDLRYRSCQVSKLQPKVSSTPSAVKSS